MDEISVLIGQRETEGLLWAQSFLRTHLNATDPSELEVVDVGIWFANAIHTGRRAGRKEEQSNWFPDDESIRSDDHRPVQPGGRIVALEKAFELLRDEIPSKFSIDDVLAVARYIESEN